MTRSLSRGSLLFRSGAVLAGAQVAGLTRFWGADPKSKPGVQKYMVAADYRKDPAGTLTRLAGIGYGYVEAFAMAISNIGDFKKMIADADLGCPSGHFAFGFAEPEKVLNDAAALGVRYAVSSVVSHVCQRLKSFSCDFVNYDLFMLIL